MWDIESGECLKVLEGTQPVSSVSISHDSKTCVGFSGKDGARVGHRIRKMFESLGRAYEECAQRLDRPRDVCVGLRGQNGARVGLGNWKMFESIGGAYGLGVGCLCLDVPRFKNVCVGLRTETKRCACGT